MSQYSMEADMVDKPIRDEDQNEHCYNIVQAYKDGQNHKDGGWVIPLFQREPLTWREEQRKSYIRSIWNGRRPFGSIVLYQTPDKSEKGWFILDGLQRISTLEHALDHSGVYELTEEQVIYHLKRTGFPVQYRTFPDHDEAYRAFVGAQRGIPLTAYEKFIGVRSLRDSWQWFRRYEEKIHAKMDRVIASHGVRDIRNRESIHKYKRHNLSLFLRLALGEKAMTPWVITDTCDPEDERSLKTAVETHLVVYLEQRNKPDMAKVIGLFENRVDNDAGTILVAWQNHDGYIKNQSTPLTILRFLHTVGVFCDVNGTSPVRFGMFTDQLFALIKGDTQYRYDNAHGAPKKIQFSIDKLDNARRLIRLGAVQEDIFMSDEEQRRQNGKPSGFTIRGLDHSHVQPISRFGPGPTEPETASLNRSKGNRHGDA